MLKLGIDSAILSRRGLAGGTKNSKAIWFVIGLFFSSRRKVSPYSSPGLKDIADDHDRRVEMVGNIEDILGQEFRVPVGRFSSVGHRSKGLCRASAGLTVVGAAPAGKDGGHG